MIADFFKYLFKYTLRDLNIGIRNLIKWLPVIWRDRDWDHHYIYEILKFKIRRQADYIGKMDRHVSAKRSAEIMRLVARLIDRQQEEFYGCEYMRYHNSNYNWIDIDEKPELKQLDIEIVSEDFDEYFKKYARQHKRAMSGEINRYNKPIEEKDKKLIAMEIAHENQHRCHMLLHRLLERNINDWWD